MITLEHKNKLDTDDNGLGRAFILAFILAQNAGRAEHIVAAAIDTLPCNDFSEPRLLAAVSAVAWKLRKNRATCCEHADTGVRLSIPPELQRVLELPLRLRYCFSLRVLAGMTVWTCAQLTSLPVEQAEYLFQLAARILAVATEPRPRMIPEGCPVTALPFIHEDHTQRCSNA